MEHGHAPGNALEQLIQAIEQSGTALAIRDAVLIYPLANVAHVLAVLVFFAAVAAMDMRILGLTRGDALSTTIARWRPIALIALVLIVGSGAVLFIPEATAISRNPSFRVKLILIAIGLANVVALSIALRRHDPMLWEAPRLARASAALSLALWLLVAACGRFIAYV